MLVFKCLFIRILISLSFVISSFKNGGKFKTLSQTSFLFFLLPFLSVHVDSLLGVDGVEADGAHGADQLETLVARQQLHLAEGHL